MGGVASRLRRVWGWSAGGTISPPGLAGERRGRAFWRTLTSLPSHRQAPGHAGGSSSRTDTSNTAPFRGYRSAPRSEAHPSKGTPEPGDNRPASHERRQNGGGASARKFPLGPHRPGCAARTGRGSSAAPGGTRRRSRLAAHPQRRQRIKPSQTTITRPAGDQRSDLAAFVRFGKPIPIFAQLTEAKLAVLRIVNLAQPQPLKALRTNERTEQRMKGERPLHRQLVLSNLQLVAVPAARRIRRSGSQHAPRAVDQLICLGPRRTPRIAASEPSKLRRRRRERLAGGAQADRNEGSIRGDAAGLELLDVGCDAVLAPRRHALRP